MKSDKNKSIITVGTFSYVALMPNSVGVSVSKSLDFVELAGLA